MSSNFDIVKGRSPRYPRVSLLNAIHYARALYDGAHRSAISSDTAYKVMGFSGKNGTSATALGSVRQYGLVDGLRGDLKVSELALRLLEPSDRPEYEKSLLEAAYKPEIFGILSRHFEGKIPKSDEPIRSHLIRVLDFSKAGADECISSLRETLQELEQEIGRYIDITEAVQDQITNVPIEAETHNDTSTKPLESKFPPDGQRTAMAGEFVRIPLTRECTAELRFSGPVTEEAAIRLMKYIDLMKDVWAED